MSRARAWLEAGLPWGILALMGAGVLGGGASEGIQRLVQQNGAVLLLVAILVQYAPRAIEAQKAQAVAMTEMSSAVRDLSQRDSYQQQEIRGVLHVVAEDVREMRATLERRPCALDTPASPPPRTA